MAHVADDDISPMVTDAGDDLDDTLDGTDLEEVLAEPDLSHVVWDPDSSRAAAMEDVRGMPPLGRIPPIEPLPRRLRFRYRQPEVLWDAVDRGLCVIGGNMHRAAEVFDRIHNRFLVWSLRHIDPEG